MPIKDPREGITDRVWPNHPLRGFENKYNPKWDVNANGMRFNLEEMLEQYIFREMVTRSRGDKVFGDFHRQASRKKYQENDYH